MKVICSLYVDNEKNINNNYPSFNSNQKDEK